MWNVWQPADPRWNWRAALFVVFAAAFWVAVVRDTLPVESLGARLPNAAAVLAVVAGQGAVSALEAAWYVIVAGAAGRRARWAAFAARLFVISSASALAVWLAQRGDLQPRALAAVLLGPHAGPGGAPGIAARMLGGAGALLAVRLALTADALAAASGMRHRGALLAVAASWAAGRLAEVALAGLVLGRSVWP